MKKLLAISFMLIALQSQAAESLLLKTFVKKDTVQLRWIPLDAATLREGLRRGYRVQRFDNEGSLQEFAIQPFEQRQLPYLNSDNPDLRHLAEYVAEIMRSESLPEASEKMSFALLSFGSSTSRELAIMLGLYFEDLQAKDARYTYRILLGEQVTSNTVSVDVNALSADPPLSTLSGSARPKLKQAYLSWEAESLQPHYAAYWIERSTDSIQFTRRNQLPYLFLKSQDETDKTHCDFADTNVTEGTTYYYRVRGINHFADAPKTTNIVRVYVPKSIYGEVHIDSIRASGTTRTVNGSFVSHRAENEIEKWVLLRSDSLNFGYRVLLEQPFSTPAFSFQAEVPASSGDRFYYKVAAVGPDFDTTFSFPYYFFTLDQIPPQMPEGLTGTVSDSGIVSLRWQSNPEPDIRGYRIYRSNALHEEFVEVSTTFAESPQFSDTLYLGSLTNDVYYRVSAVDLNYNNSALCEPIKLLKPDTIAPVPCVFSNYNVTQRGVFLRWNNSSSTDVGMNHLVRTNGVLSDTLLTWQDTTSVWTDTSGLAGEAYYYQLYSSDHAKNYSASAALYVPYETGYRNGVGELQARANREQKEICLSWSLPPGEIYAVQVYRSKNNEGYSLYQTLRGNEPTALTDRSLQLNNTYHYKFKVVYKNGVSSVLSEAVTVTY